MITEDYVSFKIAKLLKEKGFDQFCKVWYSEFTSQFGGEKYTSIEFDSHNRFEDNYKFICYAPTLQMAMKWIRDKYKILISPYALSLGWYFEIFDLANTDISGSKPLHKVGIPSKEEVLDSYEKACEAAIKLTLVSLVDKKDKDTV